WPSPVRETPSDGDAPGPSSARAHPKFCVLPSSRGAEINHEEHEGHEEICRSENEATLRYIPVDATILTMAACRHAGSNGLWAKTDRGVRFRGRASANGPAAADGAWHHRRACASRDSEGPPG